MAALMVTLAFSAASAAASHQPASEAPTIDSINPVGGPAGTEVSVNGTGLSQVETVRFGGLSLAFQQEASGNVTFEVPDIAENRYSVSVEGPDGEAELCCFALGDEVERTRTASPAAPPAAAPAAPAPAERCFEAGKNLQCTEFGRIMMDSQRDIRGEVVELTAKVTLNTNFADSGARWVLFSVRNASTDGRTPIEVDVTKFATSFGKVATSKTETDLSYETNLWVHVVDVPIDTPITLEFQVGATERGAYRLETLVMAFDRGYAPVTDSTGAEASLFAFTLLGVNQETSSLSTADRDDRSSSGSRVPSLGAVAILAVIAAVAVTVAGVRRRL